MAVFFAVTADLFFGERIERALTDLGHQVHLIDLSMTTGEPAVAADAVAALIDLEGGDGALAAIRAARSRGIPVLAFGPHVDHDLRRAGHEAGATRVVTKSKLTGAFPELVAELLQTPPGA